MHTREGSSAAVAAGRARLACPAGGVTGCGASAEPDLARSPAGSPVGIGGAASSAGSRWSGPAGTGLAGNCGAGSANDRRIDLSDKRTADQSGIARARTSQPGSGRSDTEDRLAAGAGRSSWADSRPGLGDLRAVHLQPRSVRARDLASSSTLLGLAAISRAMFCRADLLARAVPCLGWPLVGGGLADRTQIGSVGARSASIGSLSVR